MNINLHPPNEVQLVEQPMCFITYCFDQSFHHQLTLFESFIHTLFHLIRIKLFIYICSLSISYIYNICVLAYSTFTMWVCVCVCMRVWEDIDLQAHLIRITTVGLHPKLFSLICSTLKLRWKWHKCEISLNHTQFCSVFFCTNEWQRWDSHSNEIYYTHICLCV